VRTIYATAIMMRLLSAGVPFERWEAFIRDLDVAILAGGATRSAYGLPIRTFLRVITPLYVGTQDLSTAVLAHEAGVTPADLAAISSDGSVDREALRLLVAFR
jgi:hypothetical protein